MLRYTLFLLVAVSLPLHANLGENVKQLVTRYGGPSGYTEATPQFPFGTITFKASVYTLVVFLVGEKEVGAKVYKTDKSAFSDAERQAIMGADTDGTPWVSTTSADPTCLQWNRSDKATVLYDKQNNMLIFTSDEMAKVVEAVKSAPHPSAQAPAPTSPAPAPAAK